MFVSTKRRLDFMRLSCGCAKFAAHRGGAGNISEPRRKSVLKGAASAVPLRR